METSSQRQVIWKYLYKKKLEERQLKWIWNTTEITYICIMGVPEVVKKDTEKGAEAKG